MIRMENRLTIVFNNEGELDLDGRWRLLWIEFSKLAGGLNFVSQRTLFLF